MARRNVVQSRQFGTNISNQQQQPPPPPPVNFWHKLFGRNQGYELHSSDPNLADTLKSIQHHLEDIDQRTAKVFSMAVDIQRNLDNILDKLNEKETSIFNNNHDRDPKVC